MGNKYKELLKRVAYKSCINDYGVRKDRKEILEYLYFLIEEERYEEASGVEKAIELIDLYEELHPFK